MSTAHAAAVEIRTNPALGTGACADGPRIASLVPSLTELVFDLGLGSRLVARTGFCVHPRDAVREVPKVGGTKTVDVERLQALAPTDVLVNIDENERPTVERIAGFVPRVVVTHPIGVEDNLALYASLGALYGRQAQAARLAQAFGEARDAVRAAAFEPIRVLYLIWKDPWMTVAPDTYIARMLAEVAMIAVAPGAAADVRYPTLDWATLDPASFDAVLLPGEPYRFDEADAAALRAQPRFAGKPVMCIDGEMVSWYGSRAIAGLRYLLAFRRTMESQR